MVFSSTFFHLVFDNPACGVGMLALPADVVGITKSTCGHWRCLAGQKVGDRTPCQEIEEAHLGLK
jgi:hypothetical protein